MKAFAVNEDDTVIREIEIEVPEATGGEVVLRIVRSGVCHSDVHLREGFYDMGGGDRMYLRDRGFTYPLVLGHEMVGVVESAGPEAAVEVGDIRLVYPWIGCGECHRCAAGKDNLCLAGRALGVNRHGGYAEFVSVPDAKYLLDIEGIAPSVAATLACSGLTALAAVRKVLPLPAESPVVVIGAGGVGLSVVGMLNALGHKAICSVDINEANLELARKAGASSTVVVGGDIGAADVMAATLGPVEAAIDLVNNSDSAALAVAVLAKGGHLVQCGLFGGRLTIPTAVMPLKALTLEGVFTGTLAELIEVVRLAKTGHLAHPPILPGVLNRDGVSDALDRLEAGGVPGRIVLQAN